MPDKTYSSEQLDILLRSSPQDLFLGFSTISGDGICLNRALDLLQEDERELLVLVMEKNGKLAAAKEKADGQGIAAIAKVHTEIRAALVQLREKFEIASRSYDPFAEEDEE